MSVGVCNIVKVTVNGKTTICGSPPPRVIPPNVIVYARGVNGIEIWDTERSPYVLNDEVMGEEYPGTNAVSVGANGNILAIGDNDGVVYLWDTSTYPWTRLADVAVAGSPRVLYVSPTGRYVFFGSVNPLEDNILVDMADPLSPISTVINNQALRSGGVSFDQDESKFVFSTIGGFYRMWVYDLEVWPPVQITGYPAEDNIGGTGAVSINSLHDYLLHLFFGAQDIYVTNFTSKSFIAVFDNSFVGSFIFTPDGTKLITMELDGLDIFDTSNSSLATWLEIPVEVGDELDSGSSTLNNLLAVNNTSNLLALYQTAVAGDRRIVFDISQNPIVRVASFDTEGAETINGVAFVGNFS